MAENATNMDTNLVPQDDGEDTKDFEKVIDMPAGMTSGFITKLTNRWNAQFEAFMKPERERIKGYQRMYRTQKDSEKRSRREVLTPIASQIVETAQARIVPALMNPSKKVQAVPQSILPTDPEDRSSSNSLTNKVEDFVNQTLSFTTDSRKKADEFGLGAILDGTSIGRSFWNTRTSIRSDPIFIEDPNTGIPVQVDTKRTVEEVGFWDWEPVPLFNMGWDPKATSLEKATWVRQRAFRSLDQLFQMQEDGLVVNIDKLTTRSPGSNRNDDWEEQRREEISLNTSSTRDSDKVWKIDEFWATITWKTPTGQTRQQESHFMVAEDDLLIMFEENPLEPQRKPYFAFRFKLRKGEFLGSSILESVEDLIHEININKGRLSDVTMKAANTPLLVDETSGVNPRNLLVRPNGIIPVENVAGIKPLPTDGGAIAAIQNALAGDIGLAREGTASNEQAQGIGGGAGTATEANILANASGAQFGHVILRASDEWITPMAQEAFDFTRQFGEEGEMVVRESSIDGQTKELTRKDLQNDFKMVPNSPENQAVKQARVAQLNTVIERMAALVPAGINFNFEEFVRSQMFPLLDINNGQQFFGERIPVEQPTANGTPSAQGQVTNTGGVPAIGG